jgi:hypothetical protein
MIRTRILTTIGATLLAGSFLAYAQAPAPKAEGKGMEHRKEMRERMKTAHETCKDKPDRRACMSEQMCAKSEDPAKCQARAKEHGQHRAKRMDERQAMHEACTGKRGDELQKCLGDQHKGKGPREHRGHGDKPKS